MDRSAADIRNRQIETEKQIDKETDRDRKTDTERDQTRK